MASDTSLPAGAFEAAPVSPQRYQVPLALGRGRVAALTLPMLGSAVPCRLRVRLCLRSRRLATELIRSGRKKGPPRLIGDPIGLFTI